MDGGNRSTAGSDGSSTPQRHGSGRRAGTNGRKQVDLDDLRKQGQRIGTDGAEQTDAAGIGETKDGAGTMGGTETAAGKDATETKDGAEKAGGEGAPGDGGAAAKPAKPAAAKPAKPKDGKRKKKDKVPAKPADVARKVEVTYISISLETSASDSFKDALAKSVEKVSGAFTNCKNVDKHFAICRYSGAIVNAQIIRNPAKIPDSNTALGVYRDGLKPSQYGGRQNGNLRAAHSLPIETILSAAEFDNAMIGVTNPNLSPAVPRLRGFRYGLLGQVLMGICVDSRHPPGVRRLRPAQTPARRGSVYHGMFPHTILLPDGPKTPQPS